MQDISTNFRLLETMGISEDGTVSFLQAHLERLQRSAQHFEFQINIERLREIILTTAQHQDSTQRLRLLLSRNGQAEIQTESLPVLPHRLRLSKVAVNSTDKFLFHKTTNRAIYEAARQGLGADTDVLMINERGEVTETTIANAAVFRGGRWITPPESCGLLPGLARARLLAAGELIEGMVRANELSDGETIRCFNSVRGVFEIPLTL